MARRTQKQTHIRAYVTDKNKIDKLIHKYKISQAEAVKRLCKRIR